MKSKELRAKRAKLIEDARALIAGNNPSAENNAKFDQMMAEADGLKAQIDRIELADVAAAEHNEALRSQAQRTGTLPDEEREQIALEQRAFGTWMRRGPAALNEQERAIYARCFEAQTNPEMPGGWRLDRPRSDLGISVDPSGGYTIPQGFFQRLIDAQKAYGGMIDVSFVFDTTSGNALPIPTDNDTTNSGAILDDNPSNPVGTADPSFGAVTMNAYVYTSKMVKVSNSLLQDSAFPLDSWLAGKLGVRIARATNTHFTTGDGAKKPGGVVTGATLGYTAGGSTSSGSTAIIASDDLIELEHSVDPAYRKGARYMMGDAALKVIKKLKDGIGRPLWLPGLAVKEPDTINSYPYTVNQDMAVPAASAKTMLFGDFSNYFIRRVSGVQILRLTERFADYNQTAFLAFQRWDGQLVDAGTHPIKYLQQSAT